MESFGLRAPIKAQLQAILHEYPGGQLLSEGLQNAEDSDACTFCIVLDDRRHDLPESRLGGPAFLLADDGRGFGAVEWRSLQNLHQSEKRDSPRDIGRYGMGSRSYFHYADVITVLSNDKYVGLDPLCTLPSRGEGWALQLSKAPADDTVAAEAQLLALPSLVQPEGGATFRLPLRQTEESDGLGPAIPSERADELFAQWTASLADGRLLLFLASVRCVALWRWPHGAPEPELVARVRKDYIQGEPCPRLPGSLPEPALESFHALAKYVDGLDAPARADLSAQHQCIVRVRVEVRHPTNTPAAAPHTFAYPAQVPSADTKLLESTWVVAQRFDASTRELRHARVAGCNAVPVVGVARALSAGVAHGGAFCFLPIGDTQTGLPVHLNAAFELQKNRRSLWLEQSADASTLDGKQAAQAQWNRALLQNALPHLWLEVLLALTRRDLDTASRARLLPDLAAVSATWLPCAVALYRSASSEPILPHDCRGAPQWVAPAKSFVLELPTEAFKAQRGALLELYAEHHIQVQLVDLPLHVEEACIEHAGLQRLPVAEYLRLMFLQLPAVAPLAPALLALAELADQSAHRQLRSQWAQRLAQPEWVPLRGGGHAAPRAAFAPDEPSLTASRLAIVERTTANLACEKAQVGAVRRTCVAWGLKTELDWRDAVREAQIVAEQGDSDGAVRLLRHLDAALRAKRLSAVPADSHELRELQTLAFIPGVEAAPRPPTSNEPEVGDARLFAMRELWQCSARADVWAVRPTAAESWMDALIKQVVGAREGFAPLTTARVVEQLLALATIGNDQPEVSEELAHHLHWTSNSIATAHRATPEKLPSILCQLQEVAWLPSLCGERLRLLRPRHVSTDWSFARSHGIGNLGQPLDGWSGLRTSVLDAVGVKIGFPVEILLAELRSLPAAPTELQPAQLKYATTLLTELEAHAPDDIDACPVPTTENCMQPASDVFIDDAPWHQAGSVSLLHADVTRKIGRHIGCKSARSPGLLSAA